MRKLFLVRHAEPEVTGVLLGRSDPPLSEGGRAAAAELRLSVEIVYSSPLRRALETAEALALREKSRTGGTEVPRRLKPAPRGADFSLRRASARPGGVGVFNGVSASGWGQVQILHELAEISYGEWDGKPWSAIENLHPTLAAAKQRDWASVTPPGGEAWAAFAARVEGAWELIRRGPFPAAIVAHAAVNAELARLIAGGDPFQFEQPYCGVLEYEI